MIVLWLLVAHLVGDYVLQTRWEAVEKFGWTRLAIRRRTAHVASYLIPFLPIVFTHQRGVWQGQAFVVGLVVLHWLTDAQRFPSTLGDWLAWHLGADTRQFNLPPNPWPSIPLVLDQTAHLIQIAVLAQVFLA